MSANCCHVQACAFMGKAISRSADTYFSFVLNSSFEMTGRSGYNEIGDMIRSIRSSTSGGYGQRGGGGGYGYRDRDSGRRSRSPSPSRSSYRDRDRDRRRDRDWHHHDDRHGSSDRHSSRRDERWERSGKASAREWDKGKTWDDGSGKHDHGDDYKPPEPSNTVVIRNLPDSAQEDDIRQALQQAGFGNMREVRLIRNRDTGTSRGFAFVEFPTLDDANVFLKACERQGIYVHHRRVNSNYSKNRHSAEDRSSDWKCYKCQALNFRWRDACFSCHAKKIDSQLPPALDESSFDGSKYVAKNPESNVVLFRKLDTLSSEDTIRSSVLAVAPINVINVRIVKDKLTNTSRGFCFIELDSVQTSYYLIEVLKAIKPPFSIDGREVQFSYTKCPPVASSFSSSAGAIGPSLPQAAGTPYVTMEMMIATVMEDDAAANELVGLGRAVAAGRDKERTWKDMGDKGQQKSAGPTSAMAQNAVSAAAALSKHQSGSAKKGGGEMNSSFVYDSSSGLYYDSKTQYYYNPTTGLYCYYDSDRQTYVSVDAQGNPLQSDDTEPKTPTDPKLKKKKENGGKSKSAKQIAKDMARWAKRVNDAKAVAKAAMAESDPPKMGIANSLGLQHIDEEETQVEEKGPSFFASEPSKPIDFSGMGPEAEPSTGTGMIDPDPSHTDWPALACLLCKRKFPNRDGLIRHQKYSDLHKDNLRSQSNSKQGKPGKYRDRAQERRTLFGSEPPPSQF
ncbi:RNA-binding protein 5-A-like [Oscarella lobularis]|uniref:RNA-binding protein 5-A-like n=1 Tax=Oscarella lobularis TaxID=121494 RepID=UPI003313F12A